MPDGSRIICKESATQAPLQPQHGKESTNRAPGAPSAVCAPATG